MLSSGVEQVLFAQMLKYCDEFLVQLPCMQTLAYFHDNGSPSLDLFDDYYALTAMFIGLENLFHRESFLHSAFYLFSSEVKIAFIIA